MLPTDPAALAHEVTTGLLLAVAWLTVIRLPSLKEAP